MKKRYICAKEFIGKRITICQSTCKTLVGLHGLIIDETKSTFVMQTKDKRDGKNKTKQIIKNQIVFTMNDQEEIIHGKDIAKRPEERLKVNIQNE